MTMRKSLKLRTLAVSMAGLLVLLLGNAVQAAEVRLGNEGRSPNQASVGRGDRDATTRRGEAEGGPTGAPARFPLDLRSLDGTGNNLAKPDWGSAGSLLLRLTSADYADGQGEPSGGERESARVISNACAAH